MAIKFFFLQKNISLEKRDSLKFFLKYILKNEKRNLNTLTYIFCSDEYLLEINKTYLKHNYYTDVITFDLSESPDEIVGEIYISTDRVRNNASSIGVTIKEELHRVIFHGTLHLCGYKDKTPTDQKMMRDLEDKYLKKYFK